MRRNILFGIALVMSSFSFSQTSAQDLERRLSSLENYISQVDKRVKELEKGAFPDAPDVQSPITVQLFGKSDDQSGIDSAQLVSRYSLKIKINGLFDTVVAETSNVKRITYLFPDKLGQVDTSILINDAHNDFLTITVLYKRKVIAVKDLKI